MDNVQQRPAVSIRLVSLFLLGLLLGWPLATGADIRLEDPLEESPADTDLVQAFFEELTAAWVAGDQKALADLVHGDGVQIRTASARQTTYSPSQAFYYFKNLFQGRKNVDFHFIRTQDISAGDLIHGLAVWEYILDSDWQTQDTKLEFVLTDEDGAWRLTRINTIR